jgi:isoquinoline 1-oxidoreductase subunit beta
LTAEYRLPFLAHAPLEPMNATALFTGDGLDIWTGTQIPGFAQAAAARIAGLPIRAVRLHNQMIGGSFGRRLEDDFIRQAVQVAVALPGTPVKLTWSREEDFSHDFPRPMVLARARGAVAAGQVTAMDLAIAAPSVVASQMGRLGLPAAGPDVSIVAGAWDQPFAVPHLRVTGYRVPAGVPVSSWRSVGASANGFIHETFLDELIHSAGADPLEERLRLCSHAESRAVLETAGDMSGWSGPRPGPGQGRGLAFTLSFGVPVAVVVDVTDTDEGLRMTRVCAAIGVGRVLDPVNFENQVQGGLVWGLGHAMGAEITFADGMVEQTNFHAYPTIRLDQVPPILVRAVEGLGPVRGAGEPPVPPAAPALGNAIFALTGQRLRQLPFARSVTFA